MLLDCFVLLMVVSAVWKGMRKGLVLALFSFAGFFIGIMAALKCSALVSRMLSDTVQVSSKWLPFLAFLLILVATGFVIRLGAKTIETLLDLSLLGWANRLGGMLFYVLIYLLLLSVLLFYAEKMHWIKSETIQQSVSYPWLHRFGPAAADLISVLIPIFKNMFQELAAFFESLNKEAGKSVAMVYYM